MMMLILLINMKHQLEEEGFNLTLINDPNIAEQNFNLKIINLYLLVLECL